MIQLVFSARNKQCRHLDALNIQEESFKSIQEITNKYNVVLKWKNELDIQFARTIYTFKIKNKQ